MDSRAAPRGGERSRVEEYCEVSSREAGRMLGCPATMLCPQQPLVFCSPGCISLKGKTVVWLTHFLKWHFQCPKSWYLIYKWHLQHTRKGEEQGEEERSPRILST